VGRALLRKEIEIGRKTLELQILILEVISQPVLHGIGSRPNAVLDAQFVKNSADVIAHCLLAERQFISNLIVSFTVRVVPAEVGLNWDGRG
jgi:hypothetical protein